MKKVHAMPAKAPKSTTARTVAWIYAAILTVMAVGQLYAFETFLPLIEDYWLPGGYGTAVLVACVIVVSEVFALPFLLRMYLSDLMRWFSMVSGIIVALLWTALGVIAVVSNAAMMNSGMLGTKVVISSGLVQTVVAVVLLLLAGRSAWGLWPSRSK